MTYRDDSEALRARVTALEAELSSAQATVARLTGQAGAPQQEQTRSWLLGGAPRQLLLERELATTTTDEGLSATAELLRARVARVGHAAQVGRTLTYRYGSIEVQLAPTEDGRTRVRLHADHAQHQLLVAFVPIVAMLLALAPIGATFGPAALLIVLPLVAVLAFFLGRALVAREIGRARAQLTGVFEAVASVAARHASPSVRVAISEHGGDQTEEADADAEPAALEATARRA